MSAESRRETIIGMLNTADAPLSGAELARQCAVSRQIIVQDISWLRAAGYHILSTTKGYLLQNGPACTRVFHVQHTDAQIEEELNTIVDLGGIVLDVSIQHDLYGDLKAPLYTASRRQVQDFIQSLQNRQIHPLKNLTGDVHSHTVEAETEQTLDLIGKALQAKGYLLENKA